MDGDGIGVSDQRDFVRNATQHLGYLRNDGKRGRGDVILAGGKQNGLRQANNQAAFFEMRIQPLLA